MSVLAPGRPAATGAVFAARVGAGAPRVLLLNHTGEISGAEHSLLALLGAARQAVPLAVACPDEGPLRAQVQALAVPWLPCAPFAPGLRRHPTTWPGLAARGLRAAVQTARVVHQSGADIVHANSVRAGALACLARPLHRRPVVVHVRDCVPHGAPGRTVRRLIQCGATAVVANSRYVAHHFSGGGALARKTLVVHNGVDLRRFSPHAVPAASVRRLRRELLGSEAGAAGAVASPVLAVVGQITPWKGQAEAIRALALVRRAYPAARLLLVGSAKFTTASARFDNRQYLSGLHAVVRELQLEHAVAFAGERPDVPAVLALADVVLVPSWEEPFGRVVIEGMAMARPVVATNVGGPVEIVTPGETGLLVPPRDPAALAGAILSILGSPDQGQALGQRASRVARQRFSAEAHAAALLGIWRAIAADPQRISLTSAVGGRIVVEHS